MSIAARRSHRGDEYQLRVATHCLIRLLLDDDVESVQVEAVTLPGSTDKVAVDDVVVAFKDGSRTFIQAKKNQTDHREWRLTDPVLRKELVAARDQLESTVNSKVEFYSRTPFGKLEKLIEEFETYSTYEAFSSSPPASLSAPLSDLAGILGRSTEITFALVRRIGIGEHHNLEGWVRTNHSRLDSRVTNPEQAIMVLEKLIRTHQAALSNSKMLLHRQDLIAALANRGIYVSAGADVGEIRREFSQASEIGRNWMRTIAGETIQRKELQELTEWLDTEEQGCILLTDGPGTGKTCVLLAIADYVEKHTPWSLLFIKGDQFAQCPSEKELADAGLPADIVGKCAWLAREQRVVVVIDSLDVLSLHREHQSLRVFLRILDQLQRVPRVTTIVACRSFDLTYDPLLRDRKWERRLALKPLDFKTDVCPLLERINVDIPSVAKDLRELLVVPQNLRLFADIAANERGAVQSPAVSSSYELQALYLEVIVRRDPLLGDAAIAALESLAETMMSSRTLRVARTAIQLEDALVQRLISQGVLITPALNTLQFGHQTLLDALAVRRALAQGKTVSDFILSHPPFPFMRPAVQGFVRHLHSAAPKAFGRQLREAISNDEIAYHLKRAIVEILGEIAPGAEDWPLVRFIWRDHADLFHRLLSRIRGAAWFRLLADSWWPSLSESEEDQAVKARFIGLLDRWMNESPIEVVERWRAALAGSWGETHNVTWTIQIQLKDFQRWETAGVPDLLQVLLESTAGDKDFLCAPLSRYVEATGDGEELLWRAMSKDVTPEDHGRLRLGSKLRCEPHQFHRRHFLTDHLIASDTFLDTILSGIESWFNKGSGLDGALLYNTSWEDVRSKTDHHHADSLRILMDAVERALRHRAQRRTPWWQHAQPNLRHTSNLGIRYILLLSYLDDPEGNTEGIEVQLLDEELMRHGLLDYELGELTRKAYPYLSGDVQIKHQKLLLKRYATPVVRYRDGIWAPRSIYNLAQPIPVIFRTIETQQFIERWEGRFGVGPRQPEIYMYVGTVRSPVGWKQLQLLPDNEFERLLTHYEDGLSRADRFDENLVGGQEELCRELSVAVSTDPLRYLGYVSSWWRDGRDVTYISAVLRGASDHLEYRFGNLKPPDNWSTTDPEPNGEIIVGRILSTIERYHVLWDDEWAMARLLDACAEALTTESAADRVTWLLIRLATAREPNCDRVRIDPSKRSEPETQDLLHDSMNTPREIAAGATASLACRVLDVGLPFPDLLVPTLKRFAGDPVGSVRAAVLRRLPYLLHEDPELGWELLNRILDGRQPHLWEVAEQCFYYQLPKDFTRVRPCLDRMLSEAPAAAGETWGRLATLACLHGHLDLEELFTTLEGADLQPMWNGAIQVLATNLDKADCAEACRTGLLRALKRRRLPERILDIIDRHVRALDGRTEIRDVVAAALDAMGTTTGKLDLFGLFEWIAGAAYRDPIGTLPSLEKLIRNLEARKDDVRFLHSQPLVSALLDIMREADEMDDPSFIRRAVALQDCYLRLDVRGMEEMLDRAASRN